MRHISQARHSRSPRHVPGLRRSRGTDMQHHGALKNKQGTLRHVCIRTASNICPEDIYVQKTDANAQQTVIPRNAAAPKYPWRHSTIGLQEHDSDRPYQFLRVVRGRVCKRFIFLAPEVGLEPTTLRLTAECSAIELLRKMVPPPVADTRASTVITNPCRRVKAGRNSSSLGKTAACLHQPICGRSSDGELASSHSARCGQFIAHRYSRTAILYMEKSLLLSS